MLTTPPRCLPSATPSVRRRVRPTRPAGAARTRNWGPHRCRLAHPGAGTACHHARTRKTGGVNELRDDNLLYNYCTLASPAVHQRYTHQLRVLSLTFANLLIPKNCTFHSITVAFPCVSVTYCFKSELIIPWSQVRVLLGPPSR